MPEGDTIYKLARAMRPDLEGEVLRGVWLRDRGWLDALAGLRVAEVSSLGKHLLVALCRASAPRPAWVVHLHLGMGGRVDRYAPGSSWHRPHTQASARLETSGTALVCFRAATAEVLPASSLPFHPALARLGPDLLAREVSWPEVLARARAREPRSVAELLLDQSVACGVGNVYKSEVLFLAGVHPRTHVSKLSDATLLALYRSARRLMARNLGGGPRITVRRVSPDETPHWREPRLFVYGRAGLPCRRCGSRVRSARVGDDARATYWCARCQM